MFAARQGRQQKPGKNCNYGDDNEQLHESEAVWGRAAVVALHPFNFCLETSGAKTILPRDGWQRWKVVTPAFCARLCTAHKTCATNRTTFFSRRIHWSQGTRSQK